MVLLDEPTPVLERLSRTGPLRALRRPSPPWTRRHGVASANGQARPLPPIATQGDNRGRTHREVQPGDGAYSMSGAGPASVPATTACSNPAISSQSPNLGQPAFLRSTTGDIRPKLSVGRRGTSSSRPSAGCSPIFTTVETTESPRGRVEPPLPAGAGDWFADPGPGTEDLSDHLRQAASSGLNDLGDEPSAVARPGQGADYISDGRHRGQLMRGRVRCRE